MVNNRGEYNTHIIYILYTWICLLQDIAIDFSGVNY